MTEEKELLGSSKVSNSFGLTVTKDARKILKLKKGERLLFYRYNEKSILLKTSTITSDVVGSKLLEMAPVSTIFSVTLKPQVRKLLGVKTGNYVSFYKINTSSGPEIILES